MAEAGAAFLERERPIQSILADTQDRTKTAVDLGRRIDAQFIMAAGAV